VDEVGDPPGKLQLHEVMEFGGRNVE